MTIRLLLEHAETLKKIQSLRDEAEELEKGLPAEVVAFLQNGRQPRYAVPPGRRSRDATETKDEAVLAAGRKAADRRHEFKRGEMKKYLSMEPYNGKSDHNTESDISNSLTRLVKRGRIENVQDKSGYYRIVG